MKKNVFNSILLATVFLSIFASQQSLADFAIVQAVGEVPKHVEVDGKPYLEVVFEEPVGDLTGGQVLYVHPLVLGNAEIDMAAYKKINSVTYQFPFPDELKTNVKLHKFLFVLELEGRTQTQTELTTTSIDICLPDSIILGHCSKTHVEQRNTLREVPSITLPEDSLESTTMHLAFDYYDVVTSSEERHRMDFEYYRQPTGSNPISIGKVASGLDGNGKLDIGTAVQGEAGVQKVNYDLGKDYDTDWLIPIPLETLEAMRNHPGDLFTVTIRKMTSIRIDTSDSGAWSKNVQTYELESPVEITRTLEIINDPAAALVADTANSLSANFSRAFVPATARLELRQGTTVVETENLALEGSLPADQRSATYALSSDQVNQLRTYLNATGFAHYLVLEDSAGDATEKVVTFTGTPPDLSITNEPAATLVADTANSLSADFSRAFVPATARLELRQGTTVVETENLALEGSLPADQASATYTLDSAQVNQLRIYLGATGLEHYLVLTDTADLSVEKVVTFTGEAPDLSITNEPAAALVADTANSLSANFSRAFVPATARLELRQGTTVVETENLALEGTLPADQTAATYTLDSAQVNQLRIYLGATGLEYYLVLTDTADLSVEKVVTFTGTPPDLSITNDPTAALVADTANSLSVNFSRAFVPATARLELRQGTTVVETGNLALEGSLPADQTAATYALSGGQVNTLLQYTGVTDFKYYLVLTDTADLSVEKVVTFTGEAPDLSITNDPAAALVADTANNLTAEFSRAFVPATARLELRQGTTVVKTENLALEGTLPADQTAATYALSSDQVNQLRIYLNATDLAHYLVLEDSAGDATEKVVTFTGTPADLSITNEPAAALVADTANSLSANFSRAFVPATARLELRQGTTVVKTENLALEGTLPADQTAATYVLSSAQVNQLRIYLNATDLAHYLVLEDSAGDATEKVVTFTGTPADLSITNEPAAVLVADTANSLSVNFSRAFVPATARLELRQGTTVVKIENLALEGSLPADQASAAYTLDSAQVNQLRIYLGATGLEHYLVLTDTADLSVEKVVTFTGTPPDLSITTDLTAALVADTANSLSVNFSRAFVPATARLELRQGTTVVETENLALEGSLPADQTAATYALSGGQVNTLLQYTGMTDFKYYLVLTDTADLSVEKVVTFTGEAPDLSITNEPTATLVADTANSLSANFSRAFVPATARLELRQGTTVVETENLVLEGSLPADQASATYTLDSAQVNQLRIYLGATGLEHYLVLTDTADLSVEKVVTFTGTLADLSITNEPAAALVADTANNLTAEFSRAFVPATARLELRQGTTVVKTENLALEGTLPADQTAATYALSSDQVNQLRTYLNATGFEHYLVLEDSAGDVTEKVVNFTGEAPDLSITTDLTAALVADTANSLSVNFSRAFVPATARLELRQGTTVVETENLALEGSLPADQRSATYALSGGQVNTLLQYTGVTDFKYYLVLTDTADLSVEKVVTFTGTPADLSITNEPAATLVADTANSLSVNFSRAFVPATARLELRQGTTVVKTENLALEGTLPADQRSATYTLDSAQVNQLRIYLGATGLEHYLVLTDTADLSVEKVVTFTGEAPDLSITTDLTAALVADTANSLSVNFSRAFVPATARLELRQGTTVVETENLALEGSLPADQRSATYALSGGQVNTLLQYTGVTDFKYYLVLTDTADLSVEKVVTFTGEAPDLSITNDLAAALVADTANNLTAEFSRAFVPATAKLELRQGTTVVETENLVLEGSLPADQASATYTLDSAQVNQLRIYLGATGLEHYLVLTDTADLSVEKVVTFTGTLADLSITNEPAAALVADTANNLTAEFSRAFVPATARLELRQGTTVVKTENLALEGTLPADQTAATYALSSDQVNQLRTYLNATGFEHYLVLEDSAGDVTEKVVNFTGEAPDLSITTDLTAALVADTANSLSVNFSRAFVPSSARLELRQGTTVVETENLALEGTLPADQTAATYALSGGQVNTLLQYTGVTDFKYYLVLIDTADLSVEKVVTFTGTPADLSITNEPAATLVADTANSLSVNFSRAFVPATARLELRQGTTVVKTENLALEGTLPADQRSATYTLDSAQVNQLRIYLGATGLEHYLVLTDTADLSVEKVVTFTGEAPDLSITTDLTAALVADTANSLSVNFSRAFVPATARLELRQGTTVVKTENLALEGTLPADQTAATYALSSDQVNQLRTYLSATGLAHYLVLEDSAGDATEKVVTFTGEAPDLSITTDLTAALVADTANSLSVNFSRAFVPSSARLELRQGTTVVKTENLALEGTLPADQTAATYALSSDQVNQLRTYLNATGFEHYLVLEDSAGDVTEKVVNFTGEAPDLSITTDLTAALVADTANSLSVNFSRAFVPATARLELRQGTTVVETENLALEGTLPADQTAATYALSGGQVNTLLQYTGVTDFKYYLVLTDTADLSIEKVVTFTGTPPDLSITNEPAATLVADTANSLSATFNRAFVPATARLELRQGGSVVDAETINLTANTLPADQLSATYTLGSDQINTLLRHLDMADVKHYLVLTDTADLSVEKAVMFSSVDLKKLEADATAVTQATQAAAVFMTRNAIETIGSRLSHLRRQGGGSGGNFSNNLQFQFADSRLDTLKRALVATHLGGSKKDVVGINSAWNHWVSGKVIIGQSEDDIDSHNNFDIRVQKLNYGLDRSRDRYTWGFSLGMVKHHSESDQLEVDSNSYSLSAYGLMRLGDTANSGQFLEAAIGYGTLNSDITDLSAPLNADSEREGNGVYASVAYRLAMEYARLRISPYGRYDISVIALDAYESRSLALGIHRQDLNLSLLSLGVEVDYEFALESGTLKPYTQLEYSRDVSDYETATAYVLSSPDIAVPLLGSKQSPETWHFKLGLQYQLRRTSMYLDYERAQSPDHLGYSQYSDALELGISWIF